MERVGDEEINVPINTTVGWMPVGAIPRQFAGGDPRHVRFRGKPVVGHYGEDVRGAAPAQQRCQVEAKGDETRAIGTEGTAVEINFGDLTNGFEFDIDVFAFKRVGQRERFSVPSSTGPLIGFADMARDGPMVESVGVVEGVRG